MQWYRPCAMSNSTLARQTQTCDVAQSSDADLPFSQTPLRFCNRSTTINGRTTKLLITPQLPLKKAVRTIIYNELMSNDFLCHIFTPLSWCQLDQYVKKSYFHGKDGWLTVSSFGCWTEILDCERNVFFFFYFFFFPRKEEEEGCGKILNHRGCWQQRETLDDDSPPESSWGSEVTSS